MAKHLERHPEPVEGCFGCRVIGISFGSVPGGTRPGSFAKNHERKFARDMDAYREAKRNGEQPDQVSREGVLKKQQQVETLDRARKKLESWQE